MINTTTTIRPARLAEAATITALVIRSKAYWGYDAAFMEACRPGLTITADYLIDHPSYVADEADNLLGFYSLTEETAQRAELDNLFIDPAAIGKGVGKLLWQHAISEARRRGYKLMTIVADPNAEAFYQHMGAITVGVVPSEVVSGRYLPFLHYQIKP